LSYAFTMQRLLTVCRMRKITARLLPGLFLIASVAMPVQAEVLDSANNGFTVRHSVMISTDRQTVYQTVVGKISEWWSSDHTVSGDAANLFLTDTLSGCFCERLGEGAGLVHLSVSFVNPGVMLKLTGGLGPLGLMGTAGNMTWEFDDAESGTVVTMQYAVGGYMPGGLDTVADAVDGVLVEQLTRLKSLLETGSPTEG